MVLNRLFRQLVIRETISTESPSFVVLSRSLQMAKQGKVLFDGKRMSGELFSLTYGALVADMIKDYDDVNQVNTQLDKMGWNMGTRLADDFLSKRTNVSRCTDCKQMAETLARDVIPMYLGVSASVSNWSSGDKEFSLILDNNPLMELVEVPQSLSALNYSQLLAGAIRGGLEAVHIKVFSSVIENASNTEIRIRFDCLLKDNLPAGEDD